MDGQGSRHIHFFKVLSFMNNGEHDNEVVRFNLIQNSV